MNSQKVYKVLIVKERVGVNCEDMSKQINKIVCKTDRVIQVTWGRKNFVVIQGKIGAGTVSRDHGAVRRSKLW